jgi:hypothetical protein
MKSKIIKISPLSHEIDQFRSIGHVLPFIMLYLVFTLSNDNTHFHFAAECPYETVNNNCFLCDIGSTKCVLCECRDNDIHYTYVINKMYENNENGENNEYNERFIKLRYIFFP